MSEFFLCRNYLTMGEKHCITLSTLVLECSYTEKCKDLSQIYSICLKNMSYSYSKTARVRLQIFDTGTFEDIVRFFYTATQLRK